MRIRHMFMILQEVDVPSPRYRIMEAFMTSDSWRTRLTDWRDSNLEKTREEVKRRQALFNEG